MMSQDHILMIRPVKFMENKIESETKTQEATYEGWGGALLAPLAGSPAFVSAFRSVFDELEDRAQGHHDRL